MGVLVFDRLASIDSVPRTSDAMGSLTDRGDGWTFEYDDRQRLHRVKNAGAIAQTNTYNARGERVAKQSGAGPNVATTTFNYDEAGRLLSEYRKGAYGSAILQKEYIWLDERPVAVVVHAGAYAGQILQIHSDHLGTPRALTTSTLAQTVVWRWDLTGSAFGEHTPENDPDGDQVSFVFNLRYPGQYFDSESGLHYNYFRDYEPGTGRYIESDPIGLGAGPSTYGYVAGSPFGWIDPLGLSAEMCTRPLVATPMVPGVRHCFLRFNGSNRDTLSFDPDGVHPDPKPEWGVCVDVLDDDNDECLRREMSRCQGPDYDFLGNNCCHCVENALKACGQSVGYDDWPNWPINPGPQPGEPGYEP